MEFAGRTLATLGELGVELAVDDFGTGYATFDFVRRVQVDTIKIAGEFMRGMERDRRDAGIVASVLTLARALELTAVAEGVETPAQHEYLRRAGCQLAQGFVYARPQPPGRSSRCCAAGRRCRSRPGTAPARSGRFGSPRERVRADRLANRGPREGSW